MKGYDNIRLWDFQDDGGNILSIVNNNINKEELDKALDGIGMTSEGQNISLTLNGKEVDTVTVEDKYLKNISFDEDTKILTFSVGDENSEDKLEIDLSKQFKTAIEEAESIVSEKISEIIGNAPDTLDTLEEIAEALKDNDGAVAAILNKQTEISNKLENKVDWDIRGDRKHIVLPNNDNILGVGPDGVEYNLAMVSKWKVADFGSNQLHMNLNSSDKITINDSEVIATEDFVKDEISKIEFPETDLSKYALKSDIPTDFYTKEEVDNKIAEVKYDDTDLVERVEALESIDHTVFATKEELESLDIPSIEGLATEEFVSNEIAKIDLTPYETVEHAEETYQIKGDYALKSDIKEYDDTNVVKLIDVPTNELPERKAINLKQGDMLLGGDNNLIMLNRWGVVDLGTSKSPINLNTPKNVRPTVQEAGVDGENAEKIAYLSDIENIEIPEAYDDTEIKERLSELENVDTTLAERVEKLEDDENVVKYKDFNGNRKTIELKNNDTISGLDIEGVGHNLVMLSKWNVADFGAPGVKFNINVPQNERPTVQEAGMSGDEAHEIAYLEDIEGYATEEWVKGQNYLTEHQSLEDYTTKTEVNDIIKGVVGAAPDALDTLEEIANALTAEDGIVGKIINTINTKANSNDVYTKEEADNKFLTEHQDISNLATKEELEEKQDKGNYLEYEDQDGRKVITFNNNDIIGALANEGETEGKDDTVHGWQPLLMLNQWNVVDLGSPRAVTNINTPNDKRPTVQEADNTRYELAYTDDLKGLATEEYVNNKIPSLENYVTTTILNDAISGKVDKVEGKGLSSEDFTVDLKNKLENLGDVVEYKDFAGKDVNGNPITRKTIELANYDNISAKTTDGIGHNLVMISQWDKADFGAPGVAMNLNTTSNGKITINDNDELTIATEKWVIDQEYAKKSDIPEIGDVYDDSELKERIETLENDTYVKYSEIDYDGFSEKRKIITLSNGELINAKSNNGELEDKIDVQGKTISLLQLNRWNVVDLGSPYTITNINTPENERPTVQEAGTLGKGAYKIAYLEDFDERDKKIASLEDKIAKLEEALVGVVGEVEITDEVNNQNEE